MRGHNCAGGCIEYGYPPAPEGEPEGFSEWWESHAGKRVGAKIPYAWDADRAIALAAARRYAGRVVVEGNVVVCIEGLGGVHQVLRTDDGYLYTFQSPTGRGVPVGQRVAVVVRDE